METKDLPGPWIGEESAYEANLFYIRKATNHDWVARIRFNGEPTMVTLNQYVRLMAAAPELLSLLLRAEDAIQALDGTTLENEKLVDDFHAAIKAIIGDIT